MDTRGCKSAEEVSVMEVSNSHGGLRRSRDTDVTSSGNAKRRRFGSQDQEDFFQLEYQSRSDLDVDFRENVASMAESVGTSDHVSSFMCSGNDDPCLDLKAERRTETESFMSSDDGFSVEETASSVDCLESKAMESLSSSTPKKKKKPVPPRDQASCRHKAKIPSAAELEEFFSEAERHEQKRFADKYNYDILKDVPMEGRYQWVGLKP